MELKNIIDRYKAEIAFQKLNGSNLDGTSSEFGEGIVISVNNLEKLINACDGNPYNSENANCDIFDISQQRKLLISFYHHLDDKDTRLVYAYAEKEADEFLKEINCGQRK